VAISETGKKGNHLPNVLKKAHFPVQQGEGQRFAKQLWPLSAPSWHGAQTSAVNCFGSALQILLSCSGYKNHPHRPAWRPLHSVLQKPGSTSPVLWGKVGCPCDLFFGGDASVWVVSLF